MKKVIKPKKLKQAISLVASTVVLRLVKVKVSVFTKIYLADKVRKYVDDCVNVGSAASLYATPAVSTAFYGEGITVSFNITEALKVCSKSPTKGNFKKLGVKKKEGIRWLGSYASQVENIANMDVNRATREAAYANILLSNLTPQKLANSSKGKPETPVITGAITGAKLMLIKITNGDSYIPSQTNFIMLELPEFTTSASPDPVVELKNGQLIIRGATGDVITKSLEGIGKSTIMQFYNTGKRYAIYAYAQNGKKLTSELSAKIIVES